MGIHLNNLFTRLDDNHAVVIDANLILIKKKNCTVVLHERFY
jgi:hypothetical protein